MALNFGANSVYFLLCQATLTILPDSFLMQEHLSKVVKCLGAGTLPATAGVYKPQNCAFKLWTTHAGRIDASSMVPAQHASVQRASQG